MWPRDVAVGIVDVRDAPVQRLVSDQAAGDLNLGKLWHPPVLPSRGPASADRHPRTRPTAGRLTRMGPGPGRPLRTPLPGSSGPPGAVHSHAPAPGTGASPRERPG